ncbi:MAG: hypothetical protein Q9M10_04645, partial [Mariprofundaceae bacterium]|nr:hypothetical protein [Mariprofundaceae bacterium]
PSNTITAFFRVIQATKVSHKHIGQYRVVEGGVHAAFGRQHWAFRLGKVRVSIPKAYRQYFRHAPRIQRGESVLVRGRIRISRKGQLFLSLHSPYDLELLK